MAMTGTCHWMAVAAAACATGLTLQPTEAQELPPPEMVAETPEETEPSPIHPELGEAEAFALPHDTVDAENAADVRPRVLLLTGFDYQFETDIDDAGGFEVTRARVGAAVDVPLNEQLSVQVVGSYGFAGYDFEDAATFDGGEAWGDISTLQGMVSARYRLNDQWAVFGGLNGASAAEDAFDDSSFTGGGFFGAGYRFGEGLSVSVGLSAVSQLEDDALVLPIFAVDWAIRDGWRLRAGALETGATEVVGLGVSYRVDEHLSVRWQVGYVAERFRLDDSGFAPGGVGQDERTRLAIVLTWRDRPGVEASLVGGIALAGQIEVEDSDGVERFNEDYDPAPFLGARLSVRF